MCIYIPSTATLAIRVLMKLPAQIVFSLLLIQRSIRQENDDFVLNESTYVLTTRGSRKGKEDDDTQNTRVISAV